MQDILENFGLIKFRDNYRANFLSKRFVLGMVGDGVSGSCHSCDEIYPIYRFKTQVPLGIFPWNVDAPNLRNAIDLLLVGLLVKSSPGGEHTMPYQKCGVMKSGLVLVVSTTEIELRLVIDD